MKNIPFKLFILSFFILPIFNGCSSNVKKIPTKLEISNYKPIRLDSRHLEIIDNWKMPLNSPYIEHTLDPTFSEILIDWASNVLLPIGGSGKVILEITESSVQTIEIPRKTSWYDIISDQQETKIQVIINANLTWIQPVGGKEGMVKIESSASNTIRESASSNDYDVVIHNTIQEAINLLDFQTREKVLEIPTLVLN
tara:strand:- start:141 stop:731 length:591 start_codon:yes stop_codon:yes gene_type:complete